MQIRGLIQAVTISVLMMVVLLQAVIPPHFAEIEVSMMACFVYMNLTSLHHLHTQKRAIAKGLTSLSLFLLAAIIALFGFLPGLLIGGSIAAIDILGTRLYKPFFG